MLDKNSLKDRITILQNANVISDDIASFGNYVVENLEPDFNQAMCEMYITHLVMALNRVRNSEPVETLDSTIFEDVKTNKNFSEAEKTYIQLEKKFPYELPQQEKEFLLMHLTNLLENK